MILIATNITYAPRDVIQFFIRILVMINLILLLYVSFRANYKAIEGVNSSEYKCYLFVQIYTLIIFCFDFLISDIFGCTEFYTKLYNFKDKNEKNQVLQDCGASIIFIRIVVRSLWVLIDVWKIIFSFKILKYIKLVFKSLQMNIYDNSIVKSDPIVKKNFENFRSSKPECLKRKGLIKLFKKLKTGTLN